MSEPGNSAWHEILVSHMGWLRSVVHCRLRQPHAVDDVLQDVIADALAIGSRWQSIEHPAPWLYRLAIRKVLMFRRSAARRNRLCKAFRFQHSSVQGDVTWSGPLDVVLEEELQQMVARAVSRLDGRDAEILMVKYVHGWTYLQMSENLGIDYQKVVHRLRRARNRLRAELSNDRVGES